MTKKVKIIISSVCAAVLLFIIILVSAISCNNKKSNDTPSESSSSETGSSAECTYLSFELTSDGSSYVVSNITDATLTEIVVPSTYNGKSVTEIKKHAIYQNSNITKIYLPETITFIQGDAIMHNSSLTEITLMNKNIHIGEDFLTFCTSIQTINYNGTQEEWNSVKKDRDWNYNTLQHNAYTIKCTDGDIKVNQ